MEPRFIEDYPPVKMIMNSIGDYAFPNMPCGVLPFYIKNTHIVWGCVESNRVGPITITPPTGTQDIIAYKDGQRLVFEVAKPFPNTQYECLAPYVGKSFSGENYQKIVQCLLANKFAVFIENPIATAIHETCEEHGADFRRNGKNIENVIEFYDFTPQTILAKRGTTMQKVVAAFLEDADGIALNYTDKIEQKIPINKGKHFYERGHWKTLDEVKTILNEQSLIYSQPNDITNYLSAEQLALCHAELKAFESRVLLLDKIEQTIVCYLKTKNIEVASCSEHEKLDFNVIRNAKSLVNSPKNHPGLRFLSQNTPPTSKEPTSEPIKTLHLR